MERERLEAWIAEGCSLTEMGRRADRHPSTVGYWVRKHGLRAARADRHAARGSLDPDHLAQLVGADLSVREIGTRVGRSPTTVRYWLRRHGLRTTRAARRGRRPEIEALGDCPRHGRVPFYGPLGTRRCARCRAEAVTRWRQHAKLRLVAEAGGCCAACGYDRCVAALQFHHLDPRAKRFGLATRGLARSIEALRAEAAGCILLCANCHAEVEAGVRRLPPAISTTSGSRSPTDHQCD